ncbi:DUF3903 domain-containing protein [Bacillus cytotoxicus]|uniref:DUF3903 domain-containing protein n=1 Tax=Bacillus cytotoxicus TaxID=580165 RepID=A0ACC6A2X6_9BACI|nr:DUF3903 domain-containing protein [Bacillus cytotoxicus]HDX9578179.1 DUF3903 domain-containing protein [Bacillus pseudomycoides]
MKISKYVVDCVFCEKNRGTRQATVTIAASSNTLAIQKITEECQRRFGKTLLLKTEVTKEEFITETTKS